jgi:ribonuclease Z
MREKGLSPNPIDVILFTHYHADHISGLPGMLLTMGNAERKEPLTLVGPAGLERVATALRVIAPELPFQVNCVEIEGSSQEFVNNGYHIKAFKVSHSVPCYGYTLEIPRAGKFSAERAKEQEIPLKLWNPLQKGNTVEFEGRVYKPEMVMGPPRKGLKVTYTTDTRPTQSILDTAVGSDLFICEGMYGEADKFEKALAHKHMMFKEAAELAKAAQPKEMWLTHYSPSLVNPMEFMQDTKKIFPNTIAAKDGRSCTLRFTE